jgi:hypothetical protein
MDDLIAAIIARLKRNAVDAGYDAAAEHERGAFRYHFGRRDAFRDASALVRQMWEEEQARIVEEERGDQPHTDPLYSMGSGDISSYDPWEPVRSLPPTVAWHEEGR